ncbi:hypothetical protein ALC56_09450 [Trachymyrmex septentrionalis]|uniref:Uncharacterized protein n=1 Tax=Trachymyrmex septentrionalis TaxID=34720 RepID=A0A195F8W6_9HYME|nr:hypothetical protein ALC56_09450 [Trachymyrmex septentrionalis]
MIQGHGSPLLRSNLEPGMYPSAQQLGQTVIMTTAQPRQPNPTNASLSIPVSLVPRQLAVRKYPRGQGGLLENKVNRSGDENQMSQAPDARRKRCRNGHNSRM